MTESFGTEKFETKYRKIYSKKIGRIRNIAKPEFEDDPANPLQRQEDIEDDPKKIERRPKVHGYRTASTRFGLGSPHRILRWFWMIRRNQQTGHWVKKLSKGGKKAKK